MNGRMDEQGDPRPESRPQIRAVVFDMDGLMFNTEDLYDEVGTELLARRGHAFTTELKHQIMGLPGPRAFEVIRQTCDLADSVERLQTESDAIFLDLLPSRIQMLPGLAELLTLIEQRGLPKAIATSSHLAFARQALGFFDLEPRFQFILSGDQIERGKPEPDIYLEACRRLDVSPAETLVLEDSWNGSLAAAAAGTWLVVVPTHHSAHFEFTHARLRVGSLADRELVAILENSTHPA